MTDKKLEKSGFRIIFLRHGIAVDREDYEGNDADRPLTSKGKKEVKKVATALAQYFQPSVVFTSDFLRARQTAKGCRKMLIRETKQYIELVETELLRPTAKWNDWDLWLKRQCKEKEIDCCVIVGHEPCMTNFLGHYLKLKQTHIDLKKAGIAVIEKDENVKEWTLTGLISPRILS